MAKKTTPKKGQGTSTYAQRRRAANEAIPDSGKTLLDKLEAAARSNKLQAFTKKSAEWFRKKTALMGGTKTRTTLLADGVRTKGIIKKVARPGYMYTFIYEALHQDDLPYWDAFPLIIMVGPAEGGFYGLNMHYLPPKARAVLFNKLVELSSDTRYNEKTRIVATYAMLKAASKYSLFKPCFKHYLYEQLFSHLVLVPGNHWEAAMYLPSANFQKATNAKVWRESLIKGA